MDNGAAAWTIFARDACLDCHNASYHLLSERVATLEELCPENTKGRHDRARAMGFLSCMRICEYVEPDSEHAGFQAFVPTNYIAGPGGHAGRGRDAKPGTSHQGEVTAILHAVINLCSLTLRQF